MKHSPTPWAARPYERCDRRWVSEIVDSSGNCIAETTVSYLSREHDNAIENAEFIVKTANSCDRLEKENSRLRTALETISKTIWENIDPFCNDDCCAPWRDVAKIADSALQEN